MAVETLRAVETLQWGPTGNPLEVIPGEVCLFLADEDGNTQGYGYGDGWSMIFGSPQGEITLEVGQWITRLSDGSIIVEDERPFGAKLFDAKHFRDNELVSLRAAAELRKKIAIYATRAPGTETILQGGEFYGYICTDCGENINQNGYRVVDGELIVHDPDCGEDDEDF